MSPLPHINGLEPEDYVDRRKLLRDTRGNLTKLLGTFKEREKVLVIISFLAFAPFFLPAMCFFCFPLAVIITIFYLVSCARAALPLRLPARAERRDPHSPTPGHLSFNKASGIFFLGNEAGSGKELWLEKKDILTHMLLMGTTGSGKTEALVSLAYNALATGSGFFYIDPKAEAQLNMEIWQMTRLLGRDDDFRVLNYGTTLPTDPTKRLSNTNNPFSLGGADALTQVLGSLMPPSSGGANSIFADKAMGLISGLMYALCDLRDKGYLPLSVKKIRDYLSADRCIGLLHDTRLSDMSRAALKAALLNCNFVEGKEKQPQAFYEQYGYAQSYFGRALSSLTDTYGHIYGVESGEVDFQDLVLNRRILLTLLPSMEKSPQELLSLGKITLSAIRTAAAVGLGLNIEGKESEVLGSLPVHFQGTGPFLNIVDEYAAIVTPGFEILLTQGRSLGMATIVASQDYAGIVEADPKGAQQIIANTNVKVFMRLAESERTWQLLNGLTGEEAVIETSGYRMESGNLLSEGTWQDSLGAQAQKRTLVSLKDLLEQNEGEAHCILGGLFARARLFYANPQLKGAVMRVPRLLEMETLD
ncbi:MAG: TraM recognition domain-containing protein [Deltaproteobacteria bacterium]|jgi:intracellular multiplication protein IcmO|nr:TraM recognition domain-containing protein [Deltaproteobacteria bacterium]